MTFKDYLKALDGKNVMLYARELCMIPREDGARMAFWGHFKVYYDFVTVEMTAGYPTAIRMADILSVEEEMDEGEEYRS